MSAETVDDWIEQIREITKGRITCDVWNIHRSGVYFKAFPEKGLA